MFILIVIDFGFFGVGLYACLSDGACKDRRNGDCKHGFHDWGLFIGCLFVLVKFPFSFFPL